MRTGIAAIALALSATFGGTDRQAGEGTARHLARQVGLTDAQVAAVRRGDIVTADVPASVGREIAIAGAVRVAAPAARMLDVMRDVERLEQGGGFLATRRFSTPPALEDVATLRLPDEDVADLRRCRPGRCAVKLGDGALSVLAGIDWGRPEATEEVQAMARRMAVEYVDRYRAGGSAALAVYQDAARPTSVARELEDMVRRSAALSASLPDVSAYLLSYPQGRPPGVDDFFYWSMAQFGLKPVLRINHVVVHPAGDVADLLGVVTVTQLYASHYFHAALEVRALVVDPERPGQGHYLVVLNVARSDGLTGVLGGVIRKKARDGARAGLRAALRGMKTRAEAR